MGLVKFDESTNCRSGSCSNKLLGAVTDGDVAALRRELAAGVGAPRRASLLHLAARLNQVPVVEALVAAGAPLDLADDAGDTALIVAAMHGFYQILVLLLAAGAAIELQNASGLTALQILVDHGDGDLQSALQAEAARRSGLFHPPPRDAPVDTVVEWYCTNFRDGVAAADALDLSVNDHRDLLNYVMPIELLRGAQELQASKWQTLLPFGMSGPCAKRRALFERTLKEDPGRAFQQRLKFWISEGLLERDVAEELCFGRMLVGELTVNCDWDAGTLTATTVGSRLLHDLPEIILDVFDVPEDLSEREALEEATRDLTAAIVSALDIQTALMRSGRLSLAQLLGQPLDAPGCSLALADAAALARMHLTNWFNLNFRDKHLADENVLAARVPYNVLMLFSAPNLPLVVKPPLHGRADTFEMRAFRGRAREIDEKEAVVIRRKVKWAIRLGRAPRCVWPKKYRGVDAEVFVLAAAVLPPDKLRQLLRLAQYTLDVAVADEDGTAMTFAARAGNADAMRVLGESGASLVDPFNDRRPLLLTAVQEGWETAVRVLIEIGAPLDAGDAAGWTALSMASRGRVHDDDEKARRILDLLWDAGARRYFSECEPLTPGRTAPFFSARSVPAMSAHTV